LPTAVLFPHMPLPLHVFEPRYRKMVADALEGEHTIGMTLLRPGWENDYLGRPPTYEIGCAGQVQQSETLPDGRYNIVLRGVSRFRILQEHEGEPYRLATVEALVDDPGAPDALSGARRRLTDAIARLTDAPAVVLVQAELSDEVFVNALCQSLPLEPVEQQSLLDCGNVVERCGRLIEILEFKSVERTWGKAKGGAVN
jgi:Lon protease-like protein